MRKKLFDKVINKIDDGIEMLCVIIQPIVEMLCVIIQPIAVMAIVILLCVALYQGYQGNVQADRNLARIERQIKRRDREAKAAEANYKVAMHHKPYVTVKQAVNNYNRTVKKAGTDFTGYDKLYIVVDNKNGQEYFFSRGYLTSKGNTVINKAWQKEHRK